MKFYNCEERIAYSISILSNACDWAEKNYHKKPFKKSSDLTVKKMAIFIENLKNAKLGINNRKWEDKYEEYVKGRGYDWF